MILDNLKTEIAKKLDVLEFLDIIGFTMEELVEALEEQIEANADELQRALDEF